VIAPKRITLGEKEHSSVFGILISLYALNACSDICVPSPLISFKEFPDSTPCLFRYLCPFTSHIIQGVSGQHALCGGFCNAYRKIINLIEG
jgi:hypothetical protein